LTGWATLSFSERCINYPCNRPWRSIGLSDVQAPTKFLDSRLTDGLEFASLKRWPPFTPPGRFLVLFSVRCWVDPRAIDLRRAKPPSKESCRLCIGSKTEKSAKAQQRGVD
jgi:hypothetical protein